MGFFSSLSQLSANPATLCLLGWMLLGRMDAPWTNSQTLAVLKPMGARLRLTWHNLTYQQFALAWLHNCMCSFPGAAKMGRPAPTVAGDEFGGVIARKVSANFPASDQRRYCATGTCFHFWILGHLNCSTVYWPNQQSRRSCGLLISAHCKTPKWQVPQLFLCEQKIPVRDPWCLRRGTW